MSEKRKKNCDDQLLASRDFVVLLKYGLSSIQTNNDEISQPFTINFHQCLCHCLWRKFQENCFVRFCNVESCLSVALEVSLSIYQGFMVTNRRKNKINDRKRENGRQKERTASKLAFSTHVLNNINVF